MIDLEKYRQVPFTKRDRCVVCGAPFTKPVIVLPDYPLSEIYVAEPVFEKVAFLDQAFHLCASCGHGQLENVIAPHVLYDDTYVTRTSTSASAIGALDVFLQFVDDVLKNRPIRGIVEIGCNDLYTLKRLKNRAPRSCGIDPILKGREAESTEQITLIGDFFENVDLAARGIELDLVLSSHTLEHVVEPKMFVKRLMDRASEESLFVFQFPGLEPLVKDARFDQLHHQHLSYFTLQSMLRLLEEVGGELIDYRFNPYHWGTLMAAFKKSRGNSKDAHARFRPSIVPLTCEVIARQFDVFKAMTGAANARIGCYDGEPVYGYGAALMLPLLEYHVPKIANLKCIIDEDHRKSGMYYINLPVKIVPPKDVPNLKDALVVITAINSKQVVRAIMAKLISLGIREIIVPSNMI